MATTRSDNNPSTIVKVEDAISYVEFIKKQLKDHPKVYNEFLEIMKAFKETKIDVSVVIDRVATLFRDFPELIQGFNTFLPTGYRVECASDAGSVIVTTPAGKTTRTF